MLRLPGELGPPQYMTIESDLFVPGSSLLAIGADTG
jgi:hypothetical protein